MDNATKTPAEQAVGDTVAEWTIFIVKAFVFLFIYTMALGYFTTDIAPKFRAWFNGPTHCECQKCHSDHSHFVEGLQSIKRIERAVGAEPRPVPIPNAQLQPRPLPPIQPPAI